MDLSAAGIVAHSKQHNPNPRAMNTYPSGLCTPPAPADLFRTRREFLAQSGLGFGAVSLAALTGLGLMPAMPGQAAEVNSTSPLAPKKPHFPAKAKRVLHIFAQGAPSHLDTWDPKPELSKYDGKSLPGGGTGFAGTGSPVEGRLAGLPVMFCTSRSSVFLPPSVWSTERGVIGVP